MSSDFSEDEDVYRDFFLSLSVRFWLLFIIEIPSLACSFLLLYYLIIDRTLRRSLNNHVIISLLVVGLFSQLIDTPSYLNYIHRGIIWPQLPSTCLLLWFVDTGISNLTSILMAWASIERHILVFHNRWLLTKKKRLLIHYLPLMTIILYGFIYYIIILLLFSCENLFAYTADWCLYPCYYNNEKLALYDTIVNSILPTPLIVLFSILLIIRAVRQRQSLHRCIMWRKYRKMIIQLLSISTLFLLFNLPMTSLVLAQVFGLPIGATGQFGDCTTFFYRFVSLLMPFVCLASLPEIPEKIKTKFRIRQRINMIRPWYIN